MLKLSGPEVSERSATQAQCSVSVQAHWRFEWCWLNLQGIPVGVLLSMLKVRFS